jgi:hypothetical protein
MVEMDLRNQNALDLARSASLEFGPNSTALFTPRAVP